MLGVTYRIRVSTSATTATVSVVGEIDAYGSRELRAALERADGPTVCDLSRTTFLDSTILGVVVSAYKARRDTDAKLEVVMPDGPAARIFEITGLARVFSGGQ